VFSAKRIQARSAGGLVLLGVGQLVFLGLKPPPPQRYPLSDGQGALWSLADGGVLGKLVLER
jgi:NADPH:quinone reductase